MDIKIKPAIAAYNYNIINKYENNLNSKKTDTKLAVSAWRGYKLIILNDPKATFFVNFVNNILVKLGLIINSNKELIAEIKEKSISLYVKEKGLSGEEFRVAHELTKNKIDLRQDKLFSLNKKLNEEMAPDAEIYQEDDDVFRKLENQMLNSIELKYLESIKESFNGNIIHAKIYLNFLKECYKCLEEKFQFLGKIEKKWLAEAKVRYANLPELAIDAILQKDNEFISKIEALNQMSV